MIIIRRYAVEIHFLFNRKERKVNRKVTQRYILTQVATY